MCRAKATALHKPKADRFGASDCAQGKKRPLQLFKRGGESAAEVRGRFDGFDTGIGHRGVFFFRSSLSAGNNGAGMAHAAARRRGLSSVKSDHRFFKVCLVPRGADVFRVAPDSANQDYATSFGMCDK